MREKICSSCFLSMPETKEFFYQFTTKDGKKHFRGECKECTKDKKITYYDKHRGELLDKMKIAYQVRKKGLQDSK